MQDTINEFRSELPEIERLLLNMKPTKLERRTRDNYVYDTAGLLKKLDNIRQSGEFNFVSRGTASTKELAAFLYKINFITARKDMKDGRIERRYFEENRYLSHEFADFGFAWEIHPAYRWALQPSGIQEVFRTLELGKE